MILTYSSERECNGETGAMLLSQAAHENHPTPHPHSDFTDLRAQTGIFKSSSNGFNKQPGLRTSGVEGEGERTLSHEAHVVLCLLSQDIF